MQQGLVPGRAKQTDLYCNMSIDRLLLTHYIVSLVGVSWFFAFQGHAAVLEGVEL